MKYLLLASAVNFALAAYLAHQAQKAADDWIGGAAAVLLVFIGAASFVIYLAAVFWNHRFW